MSDANASKEHIGMAIFAVALWLCFAAIGARADTGAALTDEQVEPGATVVAPPEPEPIRVLPEPTEATIQDLGAKEIPALREPEPESDETSAAEDQPT